MVLRLSDFADPWQKLVEMTAPAGGVFTLAIAAHGCPIENGFNSAPNAARALGHLVPDRLEHLHDECNIDRVHR